MKNKIIFLLLAQFLCIAVCAQSNASFQELLRKAKAGDAAAQTNVGVCYFWGDGVRQDYSESFKWAMKAAVQGIDVAQFDVGESYYYGYGVAQNHLEAFRWYMKSAEQGFAPAQSSVGFCYYNGDGTTLNYSEAFKWLIKAAEQGFAEAQYAVGACYNSGNGVGRNYYESFKWWMKSAEQGYAKAQYGVGTSYYRGEGVAQNYYEAFKWYLKAAEQGVAIAQYNVAKCYADGIGVTKNDNNASKWYMKAAEQGDDSAIYIVGENYYYGIGVAQNYSEAFKWYMKAAENGKAEAQYNVGRCYYNGTGVSKSHAEAVKWYSLAAQQNYPNAYKDMAYMYMNGDGVRRDERKAFEMIDAAIGLEPKNVEFYDAKGELYSIIGDNEHALEMWNVLITLNPVYGEKETNFSRYIKKMMLVDVDVNIPTFPATNDKTFAVIIANENYNKEANVPYAINDGNVFYEYCSNALGIPSINIHLVKNATLNDLRHEVDWVTTVMDAYDGEAKAIFYYTGHGIPDESTKSALLLPVDGYGKDASSGYSLSNLYSALGSAPAQSVLVFLDACFSGTNREGDMMASARGVAIKVNETKPVGNMVVFSASQSGETAYPYTEKKHGLFTYYLLKKLQETKGNVTMGELSDYVTKQVKNQSVTIKNKTQTPNVISSQPTSTIWRNVTLK